MTPRQRERLRDYLNRVDEYAENSYAIRALLAAHDALQAQLAEARAEVVSGKALLDAAFKELAECEQQRLAAERERNEARAEVERLRARLDQAAPHICPECGPHARVDEDCCCTACGADTYFASDPHAGVRRRDRRRRMRGQQTNGAQQTLHQAEVLKRNQRRYEIARECAAAAFGRDIVQDERLLVQRAVVIADALVGALVAREGGDDGD